MLEYLLGGYLLGGSLMGPDLPRSRNSSSTFFWRGVVGGHASKTAGMWKSWHQLRLKSAPKPIRTWRTHHTTYKAALLAKPVPPPVVKATAATATAATAKWANNWLVLKPRTSPRLTAQRNICLW